MIWLTNAVLGVNSIANFMKQISQRLNLSNIYTNHCIRATVVTLLSAHGFESRQIMRVTGHKSESSLKSYDKDNAVGLKRKISNVLTEMPSKSKISRSFSPPSNCNQNVPIPTVRPTATATSSSRSFSPPSTCHQNVSIPTVRPTATLTSSADEAGGVNINNSMSMQEQQNMFQRQFTISGNNNCTFNIHF